MNKNPRENPDRSLRKSSEARLYLLEDVGGSPGLEASSPLWAFCRRSGIGIQRLRIWGFGFCGAENSLGGMSEGTLVAYEPSESGVGFVLTTRRLRPAAPAAAAHIVRSIRKRARDLFLSHLSDSLAIGCRTSANSYKRGALVASAAAVICAWNGSPGPMPWLTNQISVRPAIHEVSRQRLGFLYGLPFARLPSMLRAQHSLRGSVRASPLHDIFCRVPILYQGLSSDPKEQAGTGNLKQTSGLQFWIPLFCTRGGGGEEPRGFGV